MAWTIWVKPTRRRPKGGWQGVYRDASGKQRSAGVFAHNQKRAALKAAADQEASIRRGSWIDPRGPRTLFQEWTAYWVRELRGTVRENTESSTQVRLANHLYPAFGTTPIGEITKGAAQRWVERMADAGLPRESISGYLGIAKTIMNAAVREEKIPKNPFAGVVIPDTVNPGRPPKVLTPAQAGVLLAAAPAHHRAVILMPLGTGMRWGEVTGLHRRDLNLDQGWVRIHPLDGNLKEVRGKKIAGPPKSRAGARVIPLPQTLVAMLRTLPTLGEDADDGPEGYVFVGRRGKTLGRNWGVRTWTPAVWDSGLYPDMAAWHDPVTGKAVCPLRYHDLRRSCATWWDADGVPRVATQELLGHATGQGLGDLLGRAQGSGSRVTERYIRPLPEHAELARAVSEQRLLEVLAAIGPATEGVAARRAQRRQWNRTAAKAGRKRKGAITDVLPMDCR